MDAAALHRLDLVDRAGTAYPLDAPRWRGDDGSPLAVRGIRGLRPGDIDTAERSIWRYAAVLPVADAARVSLGEGWTPLIPSKAYGGRVQLKLEWFNPTSSFKDRGVSVMVSHLAAGGARTVLEDSSGNGGSSLAAYAAASGLHATVVVPEATSPAKLVQMRAFGAEVVPAPGTRDEVADEAVRRAATTPYASHNWHPFFLEGVKTLGYEIWEQQGFHAPDVIVTVAGAGSIVLGCDRAFRELQQSGAIGRAPRLLVGQPEDWASIVEAVNETPRDPARPRRRSIAEGASIARPVRLPEVATAVRRSGGAAVAVSDDEIRAAMRHLAAAGLYAEPTSAVAAAAYERFRDAGVIGADESVVVVLTGTALKAASVAAEVFA